MLNKRRFIAKSISPIVSNDDTATEVPVTPDGEAVSVAAFVTLVRRTEACKQLAVSCFGDNVTVAGLQPSISDADRSRDDDLVLPTSRRLPPSISLEIIRDGSVKNL